jgi:hypothetical protein
MQKHSPRVWILNQKEIRMIFNRHVIISSETMNGNEISLRRHMQNIAKGRNMRGSIKCGMMNVSNLHTSTIGSMDLLLPIVLLSHGKLV